MSNDWVKDIQLMHEKFKVHETVLKMDNDKLRRLLDFRLSMIREELDESDDAFMNGDSEEIVDGLIDLMVFAIGTLDIFKIDPYKAWDEVLEKNMMKKPGIKKGRPNPFGFPDLIKPEGWEAPSHKNNHGILDGIFNLDE